MVVIEFEVLHHARPEILHEGVELRDEVEEQIAPLRPFEVEDDAHRLAAASTAFVAHGADALDAFFLDQVADGFRQAIARVLEWDLVDDDLVPAAVLIDARPGPQRNLAAAGRVAVEEPLPAANDPAGGEIGTRDDLHQVLDGHVGLVNQFDETVADLAQIVRRNFGRHADSDAVGAVDQQVGKLAGQNQRLAILAVIVVDVIDGVALEVLQHFGDRAEVPLRMNEPVPHRPVLGHAHERRVDRHFAMRVIALHRLADDARALAGRGRRTQSQVLHRHQNAPLRRLQPVTHIGERAADDDAHGVGQVAVLELVFNVERLITIPIAIRCDRRFGRQGWGK